MPLALEFDAGGANQPECIGYFYVRAVNRTLTGDDDQIAMPGDAREILICCQEGIAVLAPSGCNQEVDGIGRYALGSASRSQLGRSDVCRTIDVEEGKRLHQIHEAIKLLGRS